MKFKTEKSGKKNQQEESVSIFESRALSTHVLHHEVPDRTYYLRNKAQRLTHFISTRVTELYNSLSMTFALESVDLNHFKKGIWPMISSGAALLIGDYVTKAMSQYYSESDDYEFICKFLFGTAVLSYCALHRITEKQFNSMAGLSAAVASEVMAITFLYGSVFDGTKRLSGDYLSENSALVASLGTSVLLVPGTVSYLTQKLQDQLVRKQYNKGGQRSDTAVISSGFTPVSNLYFQINHFLVGELFSSSRLFQLGLISYNVLNADHVVQMFRNLPALFADLAPSTIKKLRIEQEKLQHDYEHNHTLHQVLRFTPQGASFVSVPRYQLRRGDLVYCDASIDLSSLPVSGEIIALQRDEKGRFLERLEEKKYSVNLKAQNGEDRWIENTSKLTFTSNYSKVDLRAVHEGKQHGVLVGDGLNLYGNKNVFIQIMPEQELVLSSDYEKKSVINQIIADRKQKSVLHSILASVAMAGILKRDLASLPAESIRLMFTLFQTMIPFSESFLRDAVNGRLLKKLNQNLNEYAFESQDAMRVVDLCNALGGYYKDRFSRGVAIVSDKTGTLTTNKMDVLGLWTSKMPTDVQRALKEERSLLMPGKKEQFEIFMAFIGAYTNNKKELEPEEFAILQLFKCLLRNDECLQVSTQGNNHFKKLISLDGDEKEIETFHLGLYRSFGGRFTLVDEGKNKYFVFCGIPKPEAFEGMSLLQDYSAMQSRTAVLSRDWCLARTSISEHQFGILKELFHQDDKKGIESFIFKNSALLKNLVHYVTFIIDNPVKKGAEHFIEQCRDIHVPVFIATGDTSKAAKNIAKVLCPSHAKHIISIRSDMVDNNDLDAEYLLHDTTVIFAGINPQILSQFRTLLEGDKNNLPVIIFAEMSTEEKGILARFLRDSGFFVVANGDGSNDVLMMKNSNMVLAHYSEDKTFAPGVGSLVNLSDEQLRLLFRSEGSFYELFDIHRPESLFIRIFTPLANSQEKPSEALAFKASKMTFDLAKGAGFNTKDMYQQHWFSVAFDLIWLWISFYEINESTDVPMDNQNIGASNLITKTMGIALAVAIAESFTNYLLADESTNLTSMLLMLTMLPVILRSVFSGFRMVQDRLYPEDVSLEIEEVEEIAERRSAFDYEGTMFRPARSPEESNLKLDNSVSYGS